MDASDFADECVDTTNLTLTEVVGLVRDHCRTWPGFSENAAGAACGDK